MADLFNEFGMPQTYGHDSQSDEDEERERLEDQERYNEEIRQGLENLIDESFDVQALDPDGSLYDSHEDSQLNHRENDSSFEVRRDSNINQRTASGLSTQDKSYLMERARDNLRQIHPDNYRVMYSGLVNPVMSPPPPLHPQAEQLQNGVNNNGYENMSHKDDKQSDDELEYVNPTVMSSHQNHCPQHVNNGVDSSMWLAADNDVEQVKALCSAKERRIIQLQEDNDALAKDKRALNHKIHLMKVEIIQMKNEIGVLKDDEKLKNEEIQANEMKLSHVINELEQSSRREQASKLEVSQLASEIDRLKEQVKLLSTIGSSTHQTEVNDVVRQLREKHAKEIAAWQKTTTELEGQIRTYKRAQQYVDNNTVDSCEKYSQETQTETLAENNHIDEHDNILQLAEKELEEEFGGGGDRDAIHRENQHLWELEKTKLLKAHQAEIDNYRKQLQALPSQLFETWEKSQVELDTGFVARPSYKNASTNTNVLMCTQATNVIPTDNQSLIATQDQQVQADVEFVQTQYENEPRNLSTKDCQTDETYHSQHELSQLLVACIQNAEDATNRAEESDNHVKMAQEQLDILKERYEHLKNMTGKCRREWKTQEESLRNQLQQQNSRHLQTLQKLQAKLSLVDELASN